MHISCGYCSSIGFQFHQKLSKFVKELFQTLLTVHIFSSFYSNSMYFFIFRLERDKGNLHKELMSSKANADKLNVEKAILEKDAKNHHAKLHEAQGLHNGARDNLMLHFRQYFIPALSTVNNVTGKDPWKDPSQDFTWKDPSKDQSCVIKSPP